VASRARRSSGWARHPLLLFTILVATPRPAAPGVSRALVGQHSPPSIARGPVLSRPPELRREEALRLEQACSRTHLPTPEAIDSGVAPESIVPHSPLTTAGVQVSERAATADALVFFKNTPLALDATQGSTSTVGEPTLGALGHTAFYAGNWYACVSADAGATFSYIDPRLTFPSANAGFCCDQIAYYEPTRGLLFWTLLYSDDGNTNTIRTAFATSEAEVLGNTWRYVDWHPSNFGFAATGFWLDFPDIAVSNNSLYLTANVFAIGGQESSTGVIARIPLTPLAQGQGFSYDYLVTDRASLRCTHGARSTMYFATHRSTTSMRVYRWTEGSISVSWDDASHAAYSTDSMVAVGPDGRDWAARSDTRILAAAVADGTLWFMWNAAQGGGFPYPYVKVLRLRESDRSVVGDQEIYNLSYAWLYPSIHPDEAGHLGGTIAVGGGSEYPGSAVWIADDVNGGTVAPLENQVFAVGTAGPPDGNWGDFLTTRRNETYGRTWMGAGYSIVGPSGGSVVPRFVWFGRERDGPVCAGASAVSSWRAPGGRLPDALCGWNLVNSAFPETPSLSGGALTLPTSSNNERMYYEQSNADLSVPSLWVIEARLRVVSESHDPPSIARGVAIGFTPAPHEGNFLQIGVGEIFLFASYSGMGDYAQVATDDGPHDYRIEVSGDGPVKVYYDGLLKLSGSLISAPELANFPDLWWGDGTQSASGVSEWTSFTHNGSGRECGHLFDFVSGLGLDFDVIVDGNLWTIGTSGPDLQISKPADDLSFAPQGFTLGAVQSRFIVDGDFSVTVDYELPDFTRDAATAHTLNESILALTPATPGPGPFFEILRFVSGSFPTPYIEAFSSSGAPIGLQPAPPAVVPSGRYRVTRSSDVMTAWYAPLGCEDFTAIGSEGGFSGPMRLELAAAQGTDAAGFDRAHAPVNISFDNLIVDGLIQPAIVAVSSLAAPTSAWLGQSFPNPGRAATTIRLGLPRKSRIRLAVHDVGGRLVRTLFEGAAPAGVQSLAWDGRSTDGRAVPAGVYFYELAIDGKRLSRRLVLLR